MWVWGSVPKAPRPAWGPAAPPSLPHPPPSSISMPRAWRGPQRGSQLQRHPRKNRLNREALRGLQATQSPLAGQGVQKPCDFRLGVQGGVLGEGFGDRFGGVDRCAGAMIERLPIQGPRPERPGWGGVDHVRLGALGGDPHFGSNSSCFAKCLRPFSPPHAAPGVSTGVVDVASQRRVPRAAPRVHSPPR